MNIAKSARSQVVLCAGGPHAMDSADRATLTRLLLERGLEVSCRHDVGTTASSGGARIVVGSFGAASSADARPDQSILDVGSRDPQTLAGTIEERLNGESHETATKMGGPGTWKPWFPVIDYSRCTNCMQCLSFCLFDVYGVSSESKIQVQNQSNCKTECPACSRVCPEVAIMFPKYRHGPINGEEIKTDDVRREAMKVDISALLGGDVYSLLRDRSAKAKSRFSKERDDERALKERQTCLIALGRDLDVPLEVLAALPSADEIMAKAETARTRAQAARQAADQTPKI